MIIGFLDPDPTSPSPSDAGRMWVRSPHCRKTSTPLLRMLSVHLQPITTLAAQSSDCSKSVSRLGRQAFHPALELPRRHQCCGERIVGSVEPTSIRIPPYGVVDSVHLRRLVGLPRPRLSTRTCSAASDSMSQLGRANFSARSSKVLTARLSPNTTRWLSNGGVGGQTTGYQPAPPPDSAISSPNRDWGSPSRHPENHISQLPFPTNSSGVRW